MLLAENCAHEGSISSVNLKYWGERSNLSDKGLNLSGSWQQGHSATYNTPSKGSIGHAFTVRIRTENQNQTSFYPFVPHEISVLVELILGHLRYLLTDVPPQPNSPPDNVLRPDRPAEASLGSKRRGCYPASDSRIGLESSSTGSSFPADSAKPVPLAVVSLDSRQGHRIPLVRTSSELAVRRPGKAPERAVPSPSPGRHEAVRSRHVSGSSSPPTVDGGCSPWRPDAVMSTTGRERHSVLRIFKGRRECTGHHATCGALPAAGPYLRLSRFQGRALQRHPFSGLVDSAVVCKGFYPPLGGNYNSRRSGRRFRRTDLANDTCLWEPKLLLRVGNRAAGACVASSPDSDLEAFSHNPAHDVPPQPNSPPDNVLRPDRPAEASLGSKRRGCYPASDSRSNRTRVKLNRVFFPR
ncbi:unnamed protein product [Brassica oleracea]